MLLTIQRMIILMILINVALQLTDLERYGKYLRLVTGCMLAIYILTPVAGLLAEEKSIFTGEAWIAEATEENAEQADETRLEYYVQSAEKQLLDALLNAGHDVNGVHVELTIAEGSATLTSVTVYCKTKDQENAVKQYLVEVYRVDASHIVTTAVEE